MKVVPPWVEEHPDVFSDPDFSITQLSMPSPTDFKPDLDFDMDDSMAMSISEGRRQPVEVDKPVAWVSVVCEGKMCTIHVC